MKKRMLLAVVLSLAYCVGFTQNEVLTRDTFTLILPIDGVSYYEQEVERSPYFFEGNILQIYPGESLLVEVTLKGDEIALMQVVKENINPERTIQLEFTQKTKDNKSEFMMLKVSNPFDKKLNYQAMMFSVGATEWKKTSIIPVQPGLSSFESWKEVIVSLVLSEWSLE
jgi:hypothetical protein